MHWTFFVAKVIFSASINSILGTLVISKITHNDPLRFIEKCTIFYPFLVSAVVMLLRNIYITFWQYRLNTTCYFYNTFLMSIYTIIICTNHKPTICDLDNMKNLLIAAIFMVLSFTNPVVDMIVCIRGVAIAREQRELLDRKRRLLMASGDFDAEKYTSVIEKCTQTKVANLDDKSIQYPNLDSVTQIPKKLHLHRRSSRNICIQVEDRAVSTDRNTKCRSSNTEFSKASSKQILLNSLKYQAQKNLGLAPPIPKTPKPKRSKDIVNIEDLITKHKIIKTKKQETVSLNELETPNAERKLRRKRIRSESNSETAAKPVSRDVETLFVKSQHKFKSTSDLSFASGVKHSNILQKQCKTTLSS